MSAPIDATPMTCAEAEPFLQAYVDGELDAPESAAYEAHLAACAHCADATRLQERFKAAVRGHLSRAAAPDHLRRRIDAALDAAPSLRRWPWQRYPRLLPAVGAAAALAVVIFSARSGSSLVIEQARRTYYADPPMDVVSANCATVADWFRGKLDFTVKAPPVRGATCQGGRLVNVADRLGAYVVVRGSDGQRVGMMVFPAGNDELQLARRRVMNGIDVHFGRDRGAAMAAFRSRDGLTYVMTAELDEPALENLVLQATYDRH